MGMFDNITCEYPLPGDPPKDRQYQTKDTSAQMLEYYRITEGGSLQYKEILRYEDRSDPEGKGIAKLFGSMTPVYGDWKAERYNGELTFYASVGGHIGDPDYKWFEYIADFVDGQLVHVREVQDERRKKDANTD